MSAYFISNFEYCEVYDGETLFYYEDSDRWEDESGYEIDDFDQDAIGKNVLEEFAGGSDSRAWIRCDDLGKEYELVRE